MPSFSADYQPLRIVEVFAFYLDTIRWRKQLRFEALAVLDEIVPPKSACMIPDIRGRFVTLPSFQQVIHETQTLDSCVQSNPYRVRAWNHFRASRAETKSEGCLQFRSKEG
jgi:hypothetical protein